MMGFYCIYCQTGDGEMRLKGILSESGGRCHISLGDKYIFPEITFAHRRLRGEAATVAVSEAGLSHGNGGGCGSEPWW